MRAWTRRVALTSIAISFFLVRAQPSENTSVTLNVIDVFGIKLPYRVASFVAVATGMDFSKRFLALKADNIPPGQYRYRVERMESASVWLSGEISVSGPTIHKTIIGDSVLALVDGKPASITVRRPKEFVTKGIIHGLPHGKTGWIRFQNVYQNHSLEVTVDDRGQFDIREPLEGPYIAIVISDNSIIALQPVRFDPRASNTLLEVTIGDPPLFLPVK